MKETPQKSLPHTTLDWHTTFRRQRSIAFIIAIILAVITFFISLNILHEQHEAFAPQTVYVATKELNASHQLTVEDIRVSKIPLAYLPENPVTNKEEIIDQFLRHQVSVGEIITTHTLKNITGKNSLIAQLHEEQVAFTVTEEWFASPFPELNTNDIISVMSSHKDRGFDSTHTIVSNITILRTQKKIGARGIQQITVAVTPEEARQLLFAHTEGRNLILLLQSG